MFRNSALRYSSSLPMLPVVSTTRTRSSCLTGAASTDGNWTVCSTDPDPGTTLPTDAPVTLAVDHGC